MKAISRILPILAIFVFLSCRTQTTAPSGTATVKGQALLVTDLDNNPTPPYNGIHVSLDGTNYSAITDDSGLFELDGVPEGTYDVRFSKAGYGDIRWIGFTIQGGGNSPIYWNEQQVWHNVEIPTLFKQSDLVTTLQSITLKDTSVYNYPVMNIHWLTGQYSGTQPGYNHQVVLYFSHHSNLSSSPGQYEYFECWGTGGWYPWDSATQSFHIPIELGYFRSNGFNSGDSVYVATYGAPYWGQSPYYDYYDPSLRMPVLTSLNQTPSPVIGLKIP